MVHIFLFFCKFEAKSVELIIIIELPYVPPILGQLLDLISPPKINISEPRFGLYDPWDLANGPATVS